MNTQNTDKKPNTVAASGREECLVRLGYAQLLCCAKCGGEARITGAGEGAEVWAECYEEEPRCENFGPYAKTTDGAKRKWDKSQREIFKANEIGQPSADKKPNKLN